MRDGRCLRCVLLLVAICFAMGLAGCGGDDSPTQPQPTEEWSTDGITWTAPYSLTGNYPSTLKYRKSGTMVHLQGFANAGGTRVQAGQYIGTLPDGCRPPATETAFMLCPTWGWPAAHPAGYIGVAGVMVFADGGVQVKSIHAYNGEQQFLAFDGMRFSTVAGADGWTNAGITWTAPFATGGSYPSTLEYKKVGDVVHLQGAANAGSTRIQSGQVIGTLPEGCRPEGETVFLLCPTWGWPTGHAEGFIGSAGVYIFTNGQVQIKSVHQYDGQQQFLMLDGLGFSTVAGGAGWTNTGIAWTSPFTAGGSYPSLLEYRSPGDLVELRRFVNAGGIRVQSGQIVCTLPEGVRPPAAHTRFLLGTTWGWPTGHATGYIGSAGVFVLPDGQLQVMSVHQYDGQQQFLSFDSRQFSSSN